MAFGASGGELEFGAAPGRRRVVSMVEVVAMAEEAARVEVVAMAEVLSSMEFGASRASRIRTARSVVDDG